jgi:glutamine amidotransferase
MTAPRVVVLDYGFGNVRSAERALARVGAQVQITADPAAALAAGGLIVPGVGAFAACMAGLRSVRGQRLIGQRVAGGRPVLGVCVGMQVLFERGVEFSPADGTDEAAEGCGQWPGVVERLPAPVLPHMGWNTVTAPDASTLFAGMDAGARFYFVHSYGVRRWELDGDGPLAPPLVTWSEHGAPFVAAVENGPLAATQFHPEKSGDAGAQLLENWVRGL